MVEVHAYTDGSCINNPGPGGIGIHMRKPATKKKKKISLPFGYTTNNEMELMAILIALISLKPGKFVTVFSDSEYSINCLCLWHHGWAANGWRKPEHNKKLIQTIVKCFYFHRVEFVKVKAHSGIKYNESADALARQGSAIAQKKRNSPDCFTLEQCLQQAELYFKKYAGFKAPNIITA
jgi:ribonuclease HI